MASQTPTSRPDTYDVLAGQTLQMDAGRNVLANDEAPNGASLTAALAEGGSPAHGRLTLNQDGTYSYTPDLGFVGTDGFTYVASDGLATSTPAAVSLRVAARSPVAVADAYEVLTGQTLRTNAGRNVLSNDSALNGLALAPVLAPDGAPAHGSVTLNRDGSFSYTPDAGFVGTDTFTYMASDGIATSTPSSVSLRVLQASSWAEADAMTSGAGGASTATASSAGTVASTATSSTNSTTVSGYVDYWNWAMAVSPTTARAYWGSGSAVLVGTAGDDVFNIYSSKVTVRESMTGNSTVVASLYSNATYRLPNPVKNLTISGDWITGFGNARSNLLIAKGSGRITLAGGAGDDVLVGNGGADTFVFNRGDGHDVVYGFKPSTDIVRLGSLTSFDAVRARMSQKGGDVVIALSSSDTLTLRHTTVGRLTAANFGLKIDTTKLRLTFGNEFSTFTSSPDGRSGWMTSMPYPGLGARTQARNGEAEYYSDSSVGVNPFSVSNGVLNIHAAPASPGKGTPAGSGLTYTSGMMTTFKSFSQLYGYFEMRAQLPSGQGFWPAFWLLPADNSWPPEIDVLESLGGDPSTNYMNVHSNDGGYNTQTTIVGNVTNASAGFHSYGVDWEADKITFYMDGTAIKQVTTPSDMHKPMYMLVDLAVGSAGSWPGAADGRSADLKVDYVRVYAPTEIRAPRVAGETYSAAAGHSARITAAAGVLANDNDLNAQRLTAVLASGGGPKHGSVTLSADGSFVFTPSRGYAGADSFRYFARDSASQSVETTVGLNVTSTAPFTRSDRNLTWAGHAVSTTAATGVLANDIDQNGLALTSTLAPGGGPLHGTLVLNANGSYTYTPAKGFAGSDRFTYVAADGLSKASPQTVSLSVVANPPKTSAETYAAGSGSVLRKAAATGVLANDTDLNGLTLTASLAPGSKVSHGSLILAGDGSFTYTAKPGYVGTDSFTYMASDSLSRSAATLVTIQVSAHAPTAHSDTYTAFSGQTLNVAASSGLLNNDVGQNGLGLATALAPKGGATHGTVSVSSTGSFTYKSNAGYKGWDNFRYIASDALSHSSEMNVSLHVV